MADKRPGILSHIFRRPRDAPVAQQAHGRSLMAMPLTPWTPAASPQQVMPDGGRAASATVGDVHMLGSEMIYSAVARVANTVALMPLRLYKGDEEAFDHPLDRLVAYDPGPRYNAFEWRRTMQANVCDSGRAYSVIRRGADNVTPVNLQQVAPERVWEIVVQETDEIWYRITWDDRIEYVPSCDMLSLRGVSANGVRGVSQHSVLRGALQYDRQIKSYSLQQMDGVNSTVVITVPNTGLSPARQAEIVKEFNQIYRESGGKAIVLQGGMQASDLKRSPVDTDVTAVEKATANRIATVNLVPPHMLGDYSDTNYATAEQTMLEYQQMTLLSWIVQWETECDRKLLTWQMLRDGYHFAMDMRALQRADVLAMANKHSISIRSGKMTINEARAEDNLPPVEGGNVPLISRDLMPLDIAIEQARLQAAAQKGVKPHARKHT